MDYRWQYLYLSFLTFWYNMNKPATVESSRPVKHGEPCLGKIVETHAKAGRSQKTHAKAGRPQKTPSQKGAHLPRNTL